MSRNLTADGETGLARRTDDEVKRVLGSGVFPDGHVVSYRVMPWGGYTSWTDEDRHAVVVYLRHVKGVRHETPEPRPARRSPIRWRSKKRTAARITPRRRSKGQKTKRRANASPERHTKALGGATTLVTRVTTE